MRAYATGRQVAWIGNLNQDAHVAGAYGSPMPTASRLVAASVPPGPSLPRPLSPILPPCRPGERGDGAVAMEAGDGREDGVEVVVDLLVCDSQDTVAKSFQVVIAVQVVGHLRRLFMNGAIELQDQSQLVTEEVGDVGTNGHLPPELETEELPAPQAFPQRFFGRGRYLSKVLSADQRTLVRSSHAMMIPLQETPSPEEALRQTTPSSPGRGEGGGEKRAGVMRAPTGRPPLSI